MKKTHVSDSPITGRRYDNRQIAHGFSAGWSVGWSVRWSTGLSVGWSTRQSVGCKNEL
jgi:hypothetical protein